MPLKLIQVNIEGDNHYDTIFPFFSQEHPDVICIQEMFAVDMPMFEDKLGMRGTHVPLLKALQAFGNQRMSAKGEWGIALFSKYPQSCMQVLHYVKHNRELPIYHGIDPNQVDRAVLAVDILKEGKTYRVATTHFTWTPGGTVTDLQRQDLQSLFKNLDIVGETVLCGDFNAPRGKEIFTALSTRFTDNIPPEITTTIDQNLHRQSGIQFVVDGLFTTSTYVASDVRVVDGVSDHCAIVAQIQRV